MRDMASTALATTVPLRSATSRVPLASWLACFALPAFCFTIVEMCSIAAEVSSRPAACSSVRCERSVVAFEISAAAFETSRVALEMATTVSCGRSAMPLKSVRICA